jgi:8-oxo-dGTP diphosphatase
MGKLDQGIAASAKRYHVVPRTLCFITHGDDVLLLRGSPSKPIWPVQCNGVGGHVEPDEDLFSAAVREMHEETGLAVQDVRLRGVVNIDAGDPQAGVLLFVFTAEAIHRRTKASAEGSLHWVPQDQVLEQPLVEDLPLILPHVLGRPAAAPPFFAHYTYDEQDRLIVTFAEHSSSDGE